MLSTQSEHKLAVYTDVGFVTVAQFMGYTSPHPIDACEVAHKEAATGFVDCAVLKVFLHAGVLVPVELPVKISLVTFKVLCNQQDGSACSPVIATVFKTGGRRVTPSPVGSTPTRFRQNKGLSWLA